MEYNSYLQRRCLHTVSIPHLYRNVSRQLKSTQNLIAYAGKQIMRKIEIEVKTTSTVFKIFRSTIHLKRKHKSQLYALVCFPCNTLIGH